MRLTSNVTQPFHPWKPENEGSKNQTQAPHFSRLHPTLHGGTLFHPPVRPGFVYQHFPLVSPSADKQTNKQPPSPLFAKVGTNIVRLPEDEGDPHERRERQSLPPWRLRTARIRGNEKSSLGRLCGACLCTRTRARVEACTPLCFPVCSFVILGDDPCASSNAKTWDEYEE